MTGLQHGFLLLSSKENQFEDYTKFIHDPRQILFHDDLLRHMDDTLCWIPTLNPAKNESHQGLCLYGVTIIESKGAGIFSSVLDCRASLFSCGPATIELTGSYGWEESSSLESGAYETVEVARDTTIESLRKLAGFARQVIEADGDYFILHLGI